MTFEMTHVLITSSFKLVFESDNGALGVSAVLVLFTCSPDPVDFGWTRRTTLTSSPFSLKVSSATKKGTTAHGCLVKGRPLAQTL
jgi:hypothetical protein